MIDQEKRILRIISYYAEKARRGEELDEEGAIDIVKDLTSSKRVLLKHVAAELLEDL